MIFSDLRALLQGASSCFLVLPHLPKTTVGHAAVLLLKSLNSIFPQSAGVLLQPTSPFL